MGDWLRSCYDKPVGSASMAAGATTLRLPLGGVSINRWRLSEDQSKGQVVRKYAVAGAGIQVNGTSIGAGKIDLLEAPVAVKELTLVVDAAPTGLLFEAFLC